MPKQTLTDIEVRNLTSPEKGTKTVWDSLPGFGVRCSQGGTKTFIVLLGSGRRKTIGRYPVISLQKARKRAQELLAERTLGKVWPKRIAAETALTEFLEGCEGRLRPRTLRDYTRLLKRLKLSGQLADISPEDIARKLDRIQALAERNHVFAAARTFFNWCVRRRYIEQSPLAHTPMPAKLAARDRVLTNEELVSIWRAAGRYGYPFGTIVELLILTGQRRSEIAALEWGWIEGDAITLRARITKNRRQHTFPIGETARGIIESIPRLHETFVFPARGADGPFSGWSKCKATLDMLIATDETGNVPTDPETGEPLLALSPWTLHDLRRTFTTNLAALGTPIHVTEKILNHISGTVSGVAAIYNRHTYMEEMRAAIDAWEAELARLLNRGRMEIRENVARSGSP